MERHAQAQAPFTKARTIRGAGRHPPGNLYDFLGAVDRRSYGPAYPRESHFMSKHAGAGHVVAVNHLYTVAKPDGLTLIGVR